MTLTTFGMIARDEPHPLLGGEEGGVLDQLRVVHDVFGHAALGVGFDLQSEFATWLQCRTLFSDDARRAAFCELVGSGDDVRHDRREADPSCGPAAHGSRRGVRRRRKLAYRIARRGRVAGHARNWRYATTIAEGERPPSRGSRRGFGGLQATLGLRRAPVEITLVDRRNLHLFQPLSIRSRPGRFLDVMDGMAHDLDVAADVPPSRVTPRRFPHGAPRTRPRGRGRSAPSPARWRRAVRTRSRMQARAAAGPAEPKAARFRRHSIHPTTSSAAHTSTNAMRRGVVVSTPRSSRGPLP